MEPVASSLLNNGGGRRTIGVLIDPSLAHYTESIMSQMVELAELLRAQVVTGTRNQLATVTPPLDVLFWCVFPFDFEQWAALRDTLCERIVWLVGILPEEDGRPIARLGAKGPRIPCWMLARTFDLEEAVGALTRSAWARRHDMSSEWWYGDEGE